MAKSSVMRLANSPEISICLKEGTSPDFNMETVGKASSSFTPGSSMASVAGKKRLPTISCACTCVADAMRPAARLANTHELDHELAHEMGHECLSMESSSVAVTVPWAARST